MGGILIVPQVLVGVIVTAKDTEFVAISEHLDSFFGVVETSGHIFSKGPLHTYIRPNPKEAWGIYFLGLFHRFHVYPQVPSRQFIDSKPSTLPQHHMVVIWQVVTRRNGFHVSYCHS